MRIGGIQEGKPVFVSVFAFIFVFVLVDLYSERGLRIGGIQEGKPGRDLQRQSDQTAK